jgi:hypothetical protein
VQIAGNIHCGPGIAPRVESMAILVSDLGLLDGVIEEKQSDKGNDEGGDYEVGDQEGGVLTFIDLRQKGRTAAHIINVLPACAD